MNRVYKSPKKSVVSLTSLLDLLFVMIFVSLIQQKTIPEMKEAKKKAAPVAKAKPKPQAKPAPPAPKTFTVGALFYFYGTSQNPGIPTGSYRMQGVFKEKDGFLRLGGVQWVNRPTNYDMVPLSGKIDASGKLFTGRIEFQGCKQFTLRKTSPGSGSNPISGSWEGIYDCSQGQTGLTLTID